MSNGKVRVNVVLEGIEKIQGVTIILVINTSRNLVAPVSSKKYEYRCIPCKICNILVCWCENLALKRSRTPSERGFQLDRVFDAVVRVFGVKTLGGVGPTYVEGISGCFQEKNRTKTRERSSVR